MANKNLLLKIEYDGSKFSGWQRQNNAVTVQGILEQVLSKVCDHPVLIDGTGRTDAGVHAVGQYATFNCKSTIPLDKLKLAANNLLHGGGVVGKEIIPIKIAHIEVKDDKFHARYNAKWKTYMYSISFKEEFDIFQSNYTYQIDKELNIEAMVRASNYFIGTHNFEAFESASANAKKNKVRTVYDISFDLYDDEVQIRITGNGFLYNMVRIMVGTLIDVGLGKKREESIKEILLNRDRSKAGKKVPPYGLYLEEISFEEWK